VSSGKSKLFEELLELMSPDSNYTKFRNELHFNIQPPCVPYLGVFLTDLTFLEDGNPDVLPGGSLINFDKRRRVATVIKEIKQYQQTPYCFSAVPIIKGFLLAGGEYVDENKCYKLSCELEPRDAKAKGRESKAWRKTSSLSKKKEAINKRFMMNVNTTEPKSPSKASPEPVKRIPKKIEDITLSDLVDAILDGNSDAVEQYLEKLDKTEEEKNKIREDVVELFEKKMDSRGAQKVNPNEEDQEDQLEIPFDMLLGYLSSGDNAAFEKYFEGKGIYEAERIRIQVLKMYEDQGQICLPKPKGK